MRGAASKESVQQRAWMSFTTTLQLINESPGTVGTTHLGNCFGFGRSSTVSVSAMGNCFGFGRSSTVSVSAITARHVSIRTTLCHRHALMWVAPTGQFFGGADTVVNVDQCVNKWSITSRRRPCTARLSRSATSCHPELKLVHRRHWLRDPCRAMRLWWWTASESGGWKTDVSIACPL
jgi:hypothetical protein